MNEDYMVPCVTLALRQQSLIEQRKLLDTLEYWAQYGIAADGALARLLKNWLRSDGSEFPIAANAVLRAIERDRAAAVAASASRVPK